MNFNTYSIYVLIAGGLPFYVGQSRSPRDRVWDHLISAGISWKDRGQNNCALPTEAHMNYILANSVGTEQRKICVIQEQCFRKNKPLVFDVVCQNITKLTDVLRIEAMLAFKLFQAGYPIVNGNLVIQRGAKYCLGNDEDELEFFLPVPVVPYNQSKGLDLHLDIDYRYKNAIQSYDIMILREQLQELSDNETMVNE